MILHHYHISPFSEKIRLMFGHTGIEWQSAKSPPLPPRKLVDPLAGGYRRIPVAQIGADIFCDTRVISDEIATLSGKPDLSYASTRGSVRKFIDHTEGALFMAVAQTVNPKSGLKMMAKHHWPWQILRLISDRAKVARKSSLPRTSRQERAQLIADFKQDLDERLAGRPHIFSDSPSLADFAVYHIVWFANLTRPGDFLEGFPKARSWQRRMEAIGHGNPVKVGKKQVFEAAAQNQPRPLSEAQLAHEMVGRKVVIRPNDYAKDQVEGIIAGADDSRWILARDNRNSGTLHVHFPATGYEVTETDG